MMPLALFLQQAAPGSHGHDDVRTVYVHDLLVDASIGAYHVERGRRQKIVVNIAVQVRAPRRPINDELVNVLDYSVLRQAALEIAGGPHVHLQETICESLADFCLALPDTLAAYVRVGKLEAFADCTAVGCELLRMRPADKPAS
jgi:7,8-dihydroneopterin aldolase/epimerase/oxygenase